MDSSYIEYLRVRLNPFKDPVSHMNIQTDQLCYPISYLSLPQLPDHDLEDDQLLNLSLQKDLPSLGKSSAEQLLIADGATHLWCNRHLEPFVLVLGMPKIGKSSLLKKLAFLVVQQWAEPNDPVPVLVSVQKVLQTEPKTKMDLIEACFSQYEEFEAFLRQKFVAGQLVLLFDGLEAAGSAKAKVGEWLMTIREVAELPLCVVASRYSGYVPGPTLIRMEVFPIKLQVSMAQHFLSELQYERFIDLVTSELSPFSEFSMTPFLLALLLDLFRFGIVGTEGHLTKGRLLTLAIKHLLGQTNAAITQALESLAYELVLKDCKEFTYFDAKRIGVDECWEGLKTCALVICIEEHKNDKGSVDICTDDDCVKDSREEAEVAETPCAGRNQQTDTTPQWIGLSKESFITYQLARSYIEKEGDKCEKFRFWNLQFQEALAAQYISKWVETRPLNELPQVFTQELPSSLLTSRKFREILMIFGSICSERVFEYLIKHLLGVNSYENCHIAERLLKARGSFNLHRGLINKLIQVKQGLARKMLTNEFFHPSPIISSLAHKTAVDSGLSSGEIFSLSLKSIENTEFYWTKIPLLTSRFLSLGASAIKPLFKSIVHTAGEVALGQHQKTLELRVLITILLQLLEVQESPETDFISPSQSTDKHSEESTILVSCGRMHVPKSDQLDALGGSQKLGSSLLEAIQHSPGLDLHSAVRLLLVLNTSMNQIHSALAMRFISLDGQCDKLEILIVLREIGFVTQHTIDIPLLCLDEALTKPKAKELLNLLNATKLKNYAIKVLLDETAKAVKAILALRALGYASKFDIDEEVIEILVQFVDHYDLTYRLEALKSLSKVLKYSAKSISDYGIRKKLAATPHVLKDRLSLFNYHSALRLVSFKCLVALWVSLDRGNSEKGVYEMAHVLVKEHRETSYLVGNIDCIFSFVLSFLNSTDGNEKKLGWQALAYMQCFKYLTSEAKQTLHGLLCTALVEKPHGLKSVLDLLLTAEPAFEIAQVHSEQFLAQLLSYSSKHMELVAKIAYKWRLIAKIPGAVGKAHLLTAPKLRLLRKLIFYFTQILDLDLSNLTNLTNSSTELDTLGQLKTLSNFYSGSINALMEHIGSPKHSGSVKLLDISDDPSCSNDDSWVGSDNKSAGSSLHFPLEDPAPINLCFELLKSSARSDDLRHWTLIHLKKPVGIEYFMFACKSWALVNPQLEFYDSCVEATICSYIPTHTLEMCKAVCLLKFKSDSICLDLIKKLSSNYSTKLYDAIKQSLEGSSPVALEALCKVVHSTASTHARLAAFKLVESMEITGELQLVSCVQALTVTRLEILVQKVWDYWLGRLSRNPSYSVPFKVQALLEYSSHSENSLLLRWAKILGILKAQYCVSEAFALTSSCN